MLQPRLQLSTCHTKLAVAVHICQCATAAQIAVLVAADTVLPDAFVPHKLCERPQKTFSVLALLVRVQDPRGY